MIQNCISCKYQDSSVEESPCSECYLGHGTPQSALLWEKKPDPEKTDAVNHPEHYTFGKYECIDEMIHLFGVKAVMDFCKCNAYKYRFRAGHKNGEEDIKKAEWYMGKLMELQRKEENAFFKPV